MSSGRVPCLCSNPPTSLLNQGAPKSQIQGAQQGFNTAGKTLMEGGRWWATPQKDRFFPVRMFMDPDVPVKAVLESAVRSARPKAGMFSASLGQASGACSMSLRSQSRARRKMASGGSAQAGKKWKKGRKKLSAMPPPVQRLKLVIITKPNMQELSLLSCFPQKTLSTTYLIIVCL